MNDLNLRTLKNIQLDSEYGYDSEHYDYVYDLRNEAKKHVQELQTILDALNGSIITKNSPLTYSIDGQINWIKYFFNLEDEK